MGFGFVDFRCTRQGVGCHIPKPGTPWALKQNTNINLNCRILAFWVALCNLHPPSCEKNDIHKFSAETSCTLAGNPRIPQQTAPTVRARKLRRHTRARPVKGFYSPKSEQLHVPPCLLCRVQRCHKRHAVSSSSQLPVECQN